MILLIFGFFQIFICETAKRQGYVAPRIISAHSGYYQSAKLSAKRTDRPEIDDVPAPDFLPGFIFGCVIMAGLTGIIVGLCLRIETIRRCECLNDVTKCIALADETEKVDSDSPLKEPLKKKGANIHNPYPNFKAPDGLPGGLIMVSESPRLNRKNSMRSLSSFRTFKSWGGIGRKVNHRSMSKGDIQRASSVTGSIVKSTVSSKKSSIKRQRILNLKKEFEDDNRSTHSSRSSGTMRSKDGNWTSHSCQQTYSRSQYQYQYQRPSGLIPRTLGSVINSPSLSRRGSGEQVVLNPYEAITVSPQSTFQKQATVNEAIVY